MSTKALTGTTLTQKESSGKGVALVVRVRIVDEKVITNVVLVFFFAANVTKGCFKRWLTRAKDRVNGPNMFCVGAKVHIGWASDQANCFAAGAA